MIIKFRRFREVVVEMMHLELKLSAEGAKKLVITKIDPKNTHFFDKNVTFSLKKGSMPTNAKLLTGIQVLKPDAN